MERHIVLFNYSKDAIPDIARSRFYSNMEFNFITSARELDFPPSKKDPDVIVVFIREEKQECLKKITHISENNMEKEIIAAVPREMLDTGVKILRHGASDFFTLPSTARTFDFYINRALERNYLHKHLCFNHTCYKSRYARSEQKYKQLFNEAPCFIFVRDREHQITEYNRKFKEYFGSHTGEYCFGILKNRDDPCRVCAVDKTLDDGTNHSSEMEIISSDGVKHTVLCWTAPLKDPQGNITHALVMLTDITEIRRLEDHLTSLGFMIGSISHGLKGLLTCMDGGIYLMEKGFESGNQEKIKDGFLMSQQMTSRIKKLVLDILYYTKTRKMISKRLPIRSFMKETLEIVRNHAGNNDVVLDWNLDSTTPEDTFEVDKESLRTAMVNILENGIEACMDIPEGKERRVIFHADTDPENVVFRIQDNGPGMDRATTRNIFTIFFSSKGNKGTGLGLYIANKVVQQHWGEITVESAKDQGTTFLIRIPRTVPETVRQRSN